MNQSDYADHLIDVYLEGITSITNDAGWEGDSMMSRLIAFHGEIPHGTGNDQSNLHMINAIDKLRDRHALFTDLRRVIGTMLGEYGESDKILALLSRRYYQGVNPRTGRVYTVRDRMYNIGHAPAITGELEWESAEKRFRRRVSKGRELLLDRMSGITQNLINCAS